MFSFQSQNSYQKIIDVISEQLSRAGISVAGVSITQTSSGDIIDIYIDRILDEEKFNEIYRYVVKNTGYMIIQPRTNEPLLRAIKIPEEKDTRLKRLILLIATLTTIFLTGLGLSQSYYETIMETTPQLEVLGMSIAYTVLFISALAIHEYGHMWASRKDSVLIDGPYFIPAPPIQLGFIGTLGAVIKMKTLPPDRRGLARLGISGPLAGFIAGIIIGVIGVMMSPIIPLEKAQEMIESSEATELSFMPLILQLMIMLRNIPDNYTLFLHPFAFIAFIIFVVTFINLMPIGQLDGGHVARSYLEPHTHRWLGDMIIITMLVAGTLLLRLGDIGIYYISLSIILLILRMIVGKHPHPGPANQYAKQQTKKYLILYLTILILTMPFPA